MSRVVILRSGEAATKNLALKSFLKHDHGEILRPRKRSLRMTAWREEDIAFASLNKCAGVPATR